jgi:hypothetical protein
VRLNSFEASSCGQNNHRESNTRDTRFYPVVWPSNTCVLPYCGVPMDEGCTQPLSSDPMINLNTTVFSFSVFPFARNLHNLEPLALTIDKSMVGESSTHKTQNHSTTTHTSEKVSTQTQREEFTTQIVLKSQER